MKKYSLIFSLLVMIFGNVGQMKAAERLCLESFCIGDDVDAISATWKPVEMDYNVRRAAKALQVGKTVDELYYDNYVKLITDQQTLSDLVPKVIHLQKFDSDVLSKLAKVKAICTPLTLTGEVDNNSSSKMLVTFRAVADDGGRGRLRVVQLEKEFNIFPPHLRPRDKDKYVSMVQTLNADFPGLVQVRDIDARAESNEVAFANFILGYRFYSDVNSPLVFRIRDLTDLEPIDQDPKRSSLCPEDY